jgi:beta-1,4-mannosyltransferase
VRAGALLRWRAARAAAPLRVLAWPAFANRQQNPYNALLYGSLRALGVRVVDFYPQRLIFGRYDIWHLHWPESILNLPRPWQALPLSVVFRFLLRVARFRGITIVWTAHNLRSHEGLYPEVEARLWRALMSQMDGFIALTEVGKEMTLARFPALRGRPCFVIPHGPFREVYTDQLSLAEARARLDLPANARVIVSLGQIRPYKNLPHLIRTFRQLPDADYRLVVAGRPATPELAEEVVAAAGGDPRIRLALDFVPEEAVQVYLRAADLVVLPYREILNSGSSILALSFARPVLVPAQGALLELQGRMGREWVHTYEGELTAEVLRATLATVRGARRDPQRLFASSSWEAIAHQTLAAYRALRS